MKIQLKTQACLIATLIVCGCSDDPATPADRDMAVADTTVPAADVGADAGGDVATPSDLATADDVGDVLLGPGWHDRATLPAPQQEVAVVALDGRIYVMGGFGAAAQQLATVIVYDPQTDSWSERASFPTPANHMNAAVVDGKIWVTGFLHLGFTPDGRTFVYDPATDAWSPDADLPAGRGRGASAVGVIDGQIYIAGGVAPGGAQAWLDVLDPTTGTWTALPDAPRAFDHAGYGVIDGKLVVAAGRNGSIASFVDAVHIYDPTSNAWTDGAPIPTARGGVASAVHADLLYVFGGEGDASSPGRVFPQVEAFDLAANSWTQLDPMPVPRHGFAGATIGDIIYLPGGARAEFLAADDTHQVYVPSTL